MLNAINARGGKEVWKTTVADYTQSDSLTHAPLAVKDKILVGVVGGEYGIRGFIAAYDANSGKEVWRFHTFAGPTEPGGNTCSAGDSYLRGGAPVWSWLVRSRH